MTGATIFGSSPKNHNLSIENRLLRITNLESSFFVIQIYLQLTATRSTKYEQSKM